MDWRQAGKLIGSLAITLGAGALGAMVTSPAISGWYRQLEKPAFSPPNWIFGPAWTFLYILMGIALFLVLRQIPQTTAVNNALILFAVQLTLNIGWSFIFFGLKSPLWAFIEILILWFAILATVIYFFRVSYAAGVLMIPYLVWVTFAAFLNGSVWVLNR